MDYMWLSIHVELHQKADLTAGNKKLIPFCKLQLQSTSSSGITYFPSSTHVVLTDTNWKYIHRKHDQSVLLLAWGYAHY